MRFSVTAALIALVAGMLQPASAASWTLSFSTYFGGSGMTSATAIAVDGSGNIYVAGWTVSTTLTGCTPVRPYSGGVDAFVAKWDGATHRLDYCSFLGGSGDDRAFAIAVDGSGYAYVTGWTMSADFPVSGALQAALAGGQNAFVAKLNPAGVLVYSSYLGGSGFDRGNAIAVDSGGSVTVVGDTTSADFPLSNPIQSSLSGQTNVFITRLSPAGDSLVYSTYLGGSGSDHGAGVALDGTGAAYLTGGTTSMNFPVVSAFQPASGGNQDAFVAKIASTGSSLLYSTYLGGSGGTVGFPETGSAIAVDSDGNAYVTGTTSSPNFPLANALFSSSVGVGIHAYVSELNPTGSGLVFSTYLGGSSIDQAAAIAVDSGGNVVVAGFTASPDFPLADPTQASLAGSYDAFVTRLNSTGTALLESTFFGGSASDAANAVAYDAANAVYIAGQTQSLNLPVHNATQPALAGTQNAFLAVLTLATEVSAPPSPTGLAATAGSDQVTLSWVASGGASSYYVYRGTTAGGESTTAIAIGVTTASYIDTGLTNGTEYYYKVAAVNGGGASVLSGEASATPEPSAPGAPTGLTLTAGNASVALTWTAPGGATSYNVYRGTTAGGENATPIAIGVTNASYADSGLTNGTTYYYRVAAINGGGASALSGEASATPEPPEPGAPTGLTLTAGNTSVALTWTAPGGATSYNVYRGTTAGGESTTPIATGVTNASYADSGLTNGTTYYYRVAAINGGGASALSGEASATPEPSAPGAPTGLTLTAGNASVALTWTAPGGATSYNVYRGTTAGGENATPIATGVTNASYADSGLTNGTTYYYRVAAINGGGASALSGEASATPQVSAPPAPTALAATAGNAQVTLSWTAISSASSYSVYRGTTAGGESTTAIASGITTASYTDGGLTNGTTYYYEVAAVNAGGTSAMSGEASATPQVSRIVDAVLRDTGGSVRLSMYATSTLSNSGGQFASDPSAAQDLNGNTFVTARDNSNSIWANVYNPNLSTWSGWQSGGGIIQGVPSIAVDTSGTGWIASRDAYNSYWLVPYTTGSGFGSWTPLQGIFSTDPVVTACGDGSIYIIGKDNWNSLWSAHYIRGSGFQGWRFGGAIVTGKPAATCGGDNAVYIVAEDSWNSNWMARVSGNTWGNWYFGGAITSVTPRIAALGNGSEAVVILDSTNVVWTTTYTEGTADGWQPWEQVGGILQDVAPAGVGGELYFAGKSPTGDLWWWQQTGNQWTWIGNNGVAAGALAAAPR
jgi:fibronectin type 3 domain-containing protein